MKVPCFAILNGFFSLLPCSVMLAIKKCISDLSPYVRKTAAHAVPKIYQ